MDVENEFVIDETEAETKDEVIDEEETDDEQDEYTFFAGGSPQFQEDNLTSQNEIIIQWSPPRSTTYHTKTTKKKSMSWTKKIPFLLYFCFVKFSCRFTDSDLGPKTPGLFPSPLTIFREIAYLGTFLAKQFTEVSITT